MVARPVRGQSRNGAQIGADPRQGPSCKHQSPSSISVGRAGVAEVFGETLQLDHCDRACPLCAGMAMNKIVT